MSDDDFSVPQQRRIAMIDELSRVAYTVSRAYMVRNGDPSLRAWEEMDYLDLILLFYQMQIDDKNNHNSK